MSTTPSTSARVAADQHSSNAATIGSALTIKGQIVLGQDLYVNGNVKGSVELVDHKLIVNPTAKVHANLKAREVIVLGCVQGDVEASERVKVHRDAQLIGRVKTKNIVIEDGAYIEGTVELFQPTAFVESSRLASLAPRTSVASC